MSENFVHLDKKIAEIKNSKVLTNSKYLPKGKQFFKPPNIK
jgi:hypothetical protein